MVYRKNPLAYDALRKLATARLSGQSGGLEPTALNLQQVQHLLEELEIHQIELELQNDHLNTARAQLEQALNQSNELYDFSPVGNLLIDSNGAITKLNLAGAQLLFSERARLLGNRLGLYVAEPHRPQLNGLLERARTEHEPQMGELVLQVDGHAPLPVQAKVVWTGAGHGWQIALVDISERRQMEEQLRASEERLKLALSAVGDGVWDWQVRTGEFVVSFDYAMLLGLAKEELASHTLDLMQDVDRDDKPGLVQKLQDCIIGKTDRFRNEHRVHCKDGSVKWVLARGAAVNHSADGQALRIIGTLVDITKNKITEVALATAAQFQQAVFDAISAQMAVLDRDGTIVQTNAAWQAYASEHACNASEGKPYLVVLTELLAPNQPTLTAVEAGLAAVAAGDLPDFHAEEPLLSTCGRRWFAIRITPVHDAAQRLVVTHEDVSVLKRAELASVALANIDALTGAFSRQHFMSLAEQELARAQRYALPLVVLMLDLDHFKMVNDTYGHRMGDAVLQSFVKTVKGVLRESDVMGRIGGEEFAVLLPNTTHDGGLALADRIICEVRSNPVTEGEKSVAYTVSIGAGSRTSQASFADLLADCDAALYRAKNSGRDRVEVSWECSAEHSRTNG
ncbi:MAG: diguanylate cyclase [Rhodoferax sp.]|uniref:sensor domain-containing diguanylate cyclase n=1 Tax=Rhodoferax sp. TaxID=50421 RepID=UPI0026343BD2|nr:diguanylate cyclase [Rhodoferax sp.]MDD2883039.1 diguanylate cyclase [Rhodoferax sp.]